MNDWLEIWLLDSKKPFVRIRSSFIPRKKDKIAVQGKIYEVVFMSFALDYTAFDNPHPAEARCNVTVKELKS